VGAVHQRPAILNSYGNAYISRDIQFEVRGTIRLNILQGILEEFHNLSITLGKKISGSETGRNLVLRYPYNFTLAVFSVSEQFMITPLNGSITFCLLRRGNNSDSIRIFDVTPSGLAK